MRSVEPITGLGEGTVGGDGFVHGGVGRQVVVLALEPALEPAREAENRLDNGVSCLVRHGLPGGAVAFDLDRHAVFASVAAALADDGGELIEVVPLYEWKIAGDGVQRFVNAFRTRIERIVRQPLCRWIPENPTW